MEAICQNNYWIIICIWVWNLSIPLSTIMVFSRHTLQLIENYTNNIINGKTNLTQFNQAEHAGLCRAGEMLIGAYIVCNYAQTSLEASANAATGQGSPTNWGIAPTLHRM